MTYDLQYATDEATGYYSLLAGFVPGNRVKIGPLEDFIDNEDHMLVGIIEDMRFFRNKPMPEYNVSYWIMGEKKYAVFEEKDLILVTN